MSLLELFVEVDDLVQKFEGWAAKWQLLGKAKRGPKPSLSVSEVMTLVIHFHQEGYRDFKHYYQKHVCKHLGDEFPGPAIGVRSLKKSQKSVFVDCVRNNQSLLGHSRIESYCRHEADVLFLALGPSVVNPLSARCPAVLAASPDVGTRLVNENKQLRGFGFDLV